MYAILADDLTGAADAGVEFARAGWRTRALGPGWLPAELAGAEVVVIDTASRGLGPAAAYGAVRQAAAALAAAGAQLLYKKIDSTLRGPLGAELDAVLDALAAAGGPALAVVCPAFPAAGRTLAGGVLYVHGVPVAQTASGRDPITPVSESWLPALLAQTALTGRRPVALCEAAERWAERLPAGGLAVVDAGSEDDLARIVQAALACTPPPLLAGSAGLARPLAIALARAHGKAAPAVEDGPAVEDAVQPGGAGGAAVLVVCGSLHPAARAQAAVLAAQIEAGTLPCACTLLMTPAVVDAVAAAGDAAGAAAAPARALAGEALAWLQAQAAAPGGGCAGLVVTGGDTLASLLGALGAGGIDLERALAPGMPLGRVSGGPWHGLRVASKAGGFGDASILACAVGAVSG